VTLLGADAPRHRKIARAAPCGRPPPPPAHARGPGPPCVPDPGRPNAAARKPEQLTWQELREQGVQGACRCRLARLDLRRRRHGHHRSTPAEVIVRLHHPKRRLRDRRDVLQRVVAAIYGLMVANNPQGSRRREVGSNIQELRSIPPLASEGRIAAGSTDGGIACYRTRSAPRR
jgi:hypothetical protein